MEKKLNAIIELQQYVRERNEFKIQTLNFFN